MTNSEDAIASEHSSNGDRAPSVDGEEAPTTDSADDAPVCSLWSSGLPTDLLGPIESWPLSRLKPYVPRFVDIPSFRGTPNWDMLRGLLQESGVREPFVILPDGQVVDGRHRLDLAQALKLGEVPVRVLAVPEPLNDADRLQLEITMAVFAAGRRHLRQAQLQKLLFGLTQAELAAGVVNSRAANLRRGRRPGPGAQGLTQKAMATSRGVSERTIGRLVRIVRDGSAELKAAVAAGDVSVKEGDRRLQTGGRNGAAPIGPAALQEVPIGAIDEQNEGAEHQSGADRSPSELRENCRTACRSEATQTEPLAGDRARSATASSDRDGAPGPVLPSSPASVQAFLRLCRELDELTREFFRATARWTGARREQRRMTILQAVRYLTEQLEWMQSVEVGRHGTWPS